MRRLNVQCVHALFLFCTVPHFINFNSRYCSWSLLLNVNEHYILIKLKQNACLLVLSETAEYIQFGTIKQRTNLEGDSTSLPVILGRPYTLRYKINVVEMSRFKIVKDV